MKRTIQATLAVALSLCLGFSYAGASTIEIQLIDIDIEYDSSTGLITDVGDPVTDELSGVFFFVDGSPAGSLVSPPEDLSIDLSIPGVFGIDPTGDTVFSAPGGTLDVFTPSLILGLDLDVVEVIYYPELAPGLFDFVFAGTIGSIDSQDLPFGLEIGDPVSVSLSAQASVLDASSTEVLSFTASGTGELQGDLVPEPVSAALLAMAFSGLAFRRPLR